MVRGRDGEAAVHVVGRQDAAVRSRATVVAGPGQAHGTTVEWGTGCERRVGPRRAAGAEMPAPRASQAAMTVMVSRTVRGVGA